MRGQQTQEAPPAPGSREGIAGHKRDKSLSGERESQRKELASFGDLVVCKMGLEVLKEYMFMADSKTFSRILIGFSAK